MTNRDTDALIKVMVVDDHVMFRSGLSALIREQADMTAVGDAADGKEAVKKAAELEPDVILMDINMPKMDGIEATQRISAASERAHIIMLTIYGDDEHVFQAILAGANGYVLKDTHSSDLLEAIRTVSRGEVIIEPYLARRVLEEFRRMAECGPDDKLSKLTHQERRILLLLGNGSTNKEIATDLFLAEQTVKNKLSVIYQKLKVNNRAEAAIRAKERGLLGA